MSGAVNRRLSFDTACGPDRELRGAQIGIHGSPVDEDRSMRLEGTFEQTVLTYRDVFISRSQKADRRLRPANLSVLGRRRSSGVGHIRIPQRHIHPPSAWIHQSTAASSKPGTRRFTSG
jgi:hypothetical protein